MSLPFEGDSSDQNVPGITGANSAGGTGVLGLSDSPGGIGVLGRSAGGIPVQGESTASPPGIAGLFIGDVSVSGNLTAQNIALLAGGGVQLKAPASGNGMLVSKLDGTNCGNLELRADTLSVTGKVGIGTPSPGSSLDVRGTVSVRGGGDLYFHRDDGFSGGSSIILDPPGGGTSDLSVQRAGGGAIAGFHVYAATSTFMDGNVGIGTTNPQRKLQISDDVVGLSFDPGISPNAGVLRFGDNTGWKLHFGRSREGSGAALDSGTDGLLMTIQDNGSVGIGTAQPSARLSVVLPNTSEIAGNKSGTLLTSSGALGPVGTEVALASFGIGVDNLNSLSLGVRAVRTSAAPLGWPSTAIGLGMDVDNTPRAGAALFLHANGNVGIGTQIPTARLHVVADETAGWGITIQNKPADDTTPGLSTLRLVNRGTGGQDKAWAIYTAAVGGGFGVQPNAFEIWEYPETQTRLQIRPGGDTILAPTGGNVGVGTTGPAYLLDLRNTTNVSQIHISGTGGDDGGYLLGFSSGTLELSGGAAWDGNNWIAKDTSASILTIGGGESVFYGSAALTVGTIFSPAALLSIGLDENGSGPKTISFARDSNDDGDAGKIAYKPDWDKTALGIVGAGPVPRTTRIWDDLVVTNDLVVNRDLVVDRDLVVNHDLDVNGGLSVQGQKRFQIDHPLDPANKYLNHFSVEGPESKNLYDGRATLDQNGDAIVELPAWFEALNISFRYQLTPLGKFAPLYIANEIRDNRFTIAGGDPGMEVYWQVTGIRNDAYVRAHPTLVEEAKGAHAERGYPLHPPCH